MALKTKAHVPQDSVEEVTNEPVVEQQQIRFDDIEFEAEFVDEEELETKKFYTISGKESWYEPTWEKFGIQDLDVGIEMEGREIVCIHSSKNSQCIGARCPFAT